MSCTLKKTGISNACIIEALAKVGVTAAVVETVKNNVVCHGFQIDNGTNVKPVVYYSSEETLEAFVEKVLKIADQPAPEIDTDNLVSKKALLNNSILCIQKQSAENLVKREYLNVELYVRVMVDFDKDNQGSIKISPQILDQAGLTEDELFDTARNNSVARATIGTMAEALGIPEELFGEVPFFVGTYRENKCHGAALLALPEVLHDFCESRGYKKVWILPSSTEEILLLPIEDVDPGELSAMVNEVNTTNVDEVLCLEPVCYQFDNKTQEVSIASSYEGSL